MKKRLDDHRELLLGDRIDIHDDSDSISESSQLSGFNQWPHVFNLTNCIVGVSVLAMPYCLQQCGIVLGTILIGACSLLTKFTCHFLYKGAVLTRRRSYEALGLYAFGSKGRRLVEILMLLYLMSSIVSFMVVIGDIGPHVLAEYLQMLAPTQRLRILVMVFVFLFVIFPLSLVRNLDSLSVISSVTVFFYFLFVVRMLMECIPRILDGKWAMDVYWWRQEGVLNTLPIISMALSCQTQLFCVADCVKDAETRKVDTIVSGAVNICSSIYAAVGLFGYVAFNDQQLHGDILLYLHPSILTQALKLMFMLSVAVSVPLMLFPCRNAVYNLFFRTEFNKYGVSEMSTVTYIALTFTILVVDLLIAVIIPNVEFILGLTGALIGSLVTIIIPSVLFIAVCPSTTKSNQSLILYAKLSTVVGILMLVCGTWAVLNTERQSTVIDVILPKQVIDYPNDVEKSAILQAGIDRIKDDIMMKQNGTGHLLVDKKVNVDDIEKKKEEISEEARKILAEMKEQRKEQDQMIKEQQKLVKELNEHHNMHIEVEKRTAVKDGMNLSQSDMISKNLSQTNSNDSKDQVREESKKVFRRETSLEQSASSRLQSNVKQSPKVVNDNGSIQVRSLNVVSQEKQPSSETNQKTSEVKTEQLNEQKNYSLNDAKTAASVIGQSDMSLKKTENVSVEKVDENKRHETMGNSLMLNVSSEANPPITEDEAKRRFSQDINVQLRSVAEIKQSVVTNNVPEKPSLEPAVSKNDLKMVGNLSAARELPATKNDPNLQKSSIVENVASKNTDKEI